MIDPRLAQALRTCGSGPGKRDLIQCQLSCFLLGQFLIKGALNSRGLSFQELVIELLTSSLTIAVGRKALSKCFLIGLIFCEERMITEGLGAVSGKFIQC